jgi:hypothetical protein
MKRTVGSRECQALRRNGDGSTRKIFATQAGKTQL